MTPTEQLVEQLSGLNMLQVRDLVTQLEDKWGIEAPPVRSTAITPAEDVRLTRNLIFNICGPNKIAAIREVRTVVMGLGLAEAKYLVENPPALLLEDVVTAEAEAIVRRFAAIGSTVVAV